MARNPVGGMIFPVQLGFGADEEESETAERFPAPADVRFFGGYGADESEIKQGHLDPTIREPPEYDLVNYRERWTQPREPDEGPGNRQVMADDWEFRNRDRRSRGFLTRPMIPTER